MVSMFKREIKVGSAVIEYSGSDHVIERINCTDRIEEEIIVQVVFFSSLALLCFLLFLPLCKTSRWQKLRRKILTQVVSMQVLSVGNLFNPDVRYSFNIPIEDKPQQFFWDAYGPWQECSRLCQGEWEARGRSLWKQSLAVLCDTYYLWKDGSASLSGFFSGRC